MIDMHSHVLFDVDDGSSTLEESIEILKQAAHAGISGMVTTPHYIRGAVTCEKEILNKKFDLLKDQIKKKQIPIELYKGHEVYIDALILKDIDDGKIQTINNSDYILLELPLSQRINNLEELIFELQIKGYRIILAHPERYYFVHEDIHRLDELIENGVLMQMNLCSLTGFYGPGTKETAMKLLKAQMIHLVGSDVHKRDSKNLKLKEPMKILKGIYGSEKSQKVLTENPASVLKNKHVKSFEVLHPKEGFFKRLFSKTH